MNKNFLRRARWHDYRSASIYLLTFAKNESVPAFGQPVREPSRPYRDPSAVSISFSETGKRVLKVITELEHHIPGVRLLQYAVMPDHVHLLVHIKERLPKMLGIYIREMKKGLTMPDGKTPLFESGYNDQILYRSRSLDNLYNYVRENPYRLMIRRENPDYFKRVHNLLIEGVEYEAYGNLFLLRNPFREQVVVHRRESEEEKATKREEWLYNAANRGVLVSPFISTEEKEIRHIAEYIGGKFIVLLNKPFRERYKPSAHDMDLCLDGRLLLIAPKTATANALSRARCLELNDLAKTIAKKEFGK